MQSERSIRPILVPRTEVSLRDVAAERPFHTVQVLEDVDSAADAWRELEAVAPISIYQTRRWLVPWIETVGRAHGITPMLVIARDRTGAPIAFLPLGLRRHGPLRVANFLGEKDSNANLGLFRPGLRWTAPDVMDLLRAIARTKPVDLFSLRNQPLEWAACANPLALVRHQPSPSFSAYGILHPGAGKRLPPDASKHLRKKSRRLEIRFGPVRHVTATDAEGARVLLAAFRNQKAARLRAQGLPDPFSRPEMMDFLERSAIDGLASGVAAIELHGLYAGERIVATFGGGGEGRRFSGMFNSFDGDVEVARSSPGELLLAEIVTQKCAQGFDTFDLGIGEALYKTHYCDRPEPLFDTIVAMTAAGHSVSRLISLRRRIKRRVKQTEWMWKLAADLRRRIGRRRS